MRRTFIIVSSILFLLLSTALAFGQGRPAWIAKVEDTIKLKEPAWKIGDHLVDDQGASYSESFRLTKGGVTGMIQITSYSILSNPIETFEGHVIAKDNIMKSSRKIKVAGLGDEGYLWPGRNANDFAEVFFRKGQTYVTVFLPGPSTAQRFAEHVAANMP
jgi:hypothetical protein